MIHSNKRKVNLLLFLVACIFVSIAATKPTTIGTHKNSTGDTGIFKNLKVLPKDISKDSLDHIMHQYTAALAVRCNFCHAFKDGKPDFASDEKEEKGIARYMITMTAEINNKYFNWEKSTRADTISVIKCVTCHHGSPHPGEMEKMGMEEHHDMPPGPPPGNNNDNGQKPPPPPNQ